MSTSSQRRKARRLALQAPFAEKVREVALSLPRRRPEPANGMLYVDRIEKDRPDLFGPDAPSYRNVIHLSEATGGRPHRRFVIPYGDPGPVQRGLSLDVSPYAGSTRYLEFTWRSWAVRAGDTEVRWFTPELVGQGATEEGARAFGAARKACAYVTRAIAAVNFVGYTWLERDMRQALEALLEFIAESDPASTRAEREAATNAEARASYP